MNFRRFSTLGVIAVLAGCSQNSTLAPTFPSSTTQTQSPAGSAGGTRASWVLGARARGPSSKIQHVVIIIQENRTTNNLFNALPGADTVRTAKNSEGQTVQLLPVPLTAPYDISHRHSAFETEYANGLGDGFDRVGSRCHAGAKCPPPDMRAYGYVPKKEVEPYYVMATRFTFASRMFQTNEGPSFPAHQYLLSGTSTISNGSSLRAAENPLTPSGANTGGCDSPAGSLVKLINQSGQEDQSTYPCFERNSLIQLVEAQQLSWHYYQAELGAGLWNAPDAIEAVRYSSEFSTDVVAPPSQVLNDIDAGNLANVVWVTPTKAESDHAGINNGSGPSWVASVVNKIGESKYWYNTAIFVTWDDWGGWYDQIVPPIYNSYELSFRVPLIVISPYAKQHYISTVQHEFGSILKFTEETFNLGSLGTTDVRSDNLSDCFDFSQTPIKFQTIPAPHDAAYFLKQPISTQNPDDDF
jgi:phospholipase C